MKRVICFFLMLVLVLSPLADQHAHADSLQSNLDKLLSGLGYNHYAIQDMRPFSKNALTIQDLKIGDFAQTYQYKAGNADKAAFYFLAYLELLLSQPELEYQECAVTDLGWICHCFRVNENKSDFYLTNTDGSRATEDCHIALQHQVNSKYINLYFSNDFQLADLGARSADEPKEIASSIKRADYSADDSDTSLSSRKSASSSSSSSSSSKSSSSSSSSKKETVRTKRCTKCGGDGEVSCSNCSGKGYKTKTVSSPNYSGKSKTSKTVKENCYRCHGSGDVDCSKCGGDGKVEY